MSSVSENKTTTKSYVFTNEWFEYQRKVLQTVIPLPTGEFHILEVGSHEGRSTVFYIDNFLCDAKSTITSIDPYDDSDPTTPVNETTFRIFLNNISKSEYPSKFNLIKGYSNDVIPLLTVKKKVYDFITIDGSHLTKDVLYDAVSSFVLLKTGGYMLFDDYGQETVRTAVDAFIKCNQGSIDVLHAGYHLILRKINHN
jgi:hypothetical protein